MITALGQLPYAWHSIITMRKHNGRREKLESARYTRIKPQEVILFQHQASNIIDDDLVHTLT